MKKIYTNFTEGFDNVFEQTIKGDIFNLYDFLKKETHKTFIIKKVILNPKIVDVSTDTAILYVKYEATIVNLFDNKLLKYVGDIETELNKTDFENLLEDFDMDIDDEESVEELGDLIGKDLEIIESKSNINDIIYENISYKDMLILGKDSLNKVYNKRYTYADVDTIIKFSEQLLKKYPKTTKIYFYKTPTTVFYSERPHVDSNIASENLINFLNYYFVLKKISKKQLINMIYTKLNHSKK